jgi:hypothetical protein
MNQRSREKNELIVSYMVLRQLVGWIGILLPIVLIVGNALVSHASRPGSMSGYYYTGMRNVFVGALCALGVFLVAYNGYDELDRWITNIAGVGAIGVALFPTKPAVPHLSASQQVVGDIHLVCAAATFIALGLMALRFTKGGPAAPGLPGLPPPFAKDNVVYRISSATILSCVLLAALSNQLPASVKAHWPLLFIFEALAVFAFGVSWFVKGRTIQVIVARLPRLGPTGLPEFPA